MCCALVRSWSQGQRDLVADELWLPRRSRKDLEASQGRGTWQQLACSVQGASGGVPFCFQPLPTVPVRQETEIPARHSEAEVLQLQGPEVRKRATAMLMRLLSQASLTQVGRGALQPALPSLMCSLPRRDWVSGPKEGTLDLGAVRTLWKTFSSPERRGGKFGGRRRYKQLEEIRS